MSPHANRGNVAIIVWNTLEAPYVWDVTNTEYEGTINLGNSTRSLLSIYFRDYVCEDKKDNTYLKEAEYVEVVAVPSTNSTLGENQFVLVSTTDTDANAYDTLLADINANRKPRGTDDKEWTYTEDDEIYAYAPAFSGLDTYFGKVVTVIFGKDNEVVSIRVIDETVEDEYLTAYEDKKLEIGENSYKFADDARVFVNTVEMTNEAVAAVHSENCTGCTDGQRCRDYRAAIAETDADAAMTLIGNVLKGNKPSWDWEKYNKVIKANVVLNSKGKVTRLDLFVSGNYDRFNTKEAVVEKVKNEVIALDNNEDIDYSEDGKYEDEEDRPRVIKDGTIIGLEDIEVGDILTYFVDGNEITTIYVSSKKVEGELTRASKEDYKLTVDGEKYYSSMEKLMVTDDKVSDAVSVADVDKYIGENVELYLNIYGEYVLMASEKATENWVFGIVTSVRDTEEDDEDDDIYRIPVRILLADGTTSRSYKFVYDAEEDKDAISLSDWEDAIGATAAGLENKFIVFAPDANNEIAYDDYLEIPYAQTSETLKIANGDYEAIWATSTTEVDNDRERIGGKIFSSNTVIFNIGGATPDPETSKSWKMLVKDSSTTTGKELAQNALLIFEEDSKTLSYVLISVSEDDYATSDAEYAIVLKDEYKEKRGSSVKRFVELLTLTGAEEFELKDNVLVKDNEDMFVEYALSGDKVKVANTLVDLPAFKKLKANEKVTIGTQIADTTDFETKLAVNVEKTYKEDVLTGEVQATVFTGGMDPTFDNDGTRGISGNYYVHTFTNILPDTGKFIIVQENAALEEYDGDDDISNSTGVWTKTKKYNADGDKDLKVLVKTGEDVKVTVKTLDASGDNVVKVSVYELDASGLDVVKSTDTNYGTASTTPTVGSNPTTFGLLKSNFKVVDTQKLLLEYEDDEDEVPYSLGEVIVDEDVVVYDARNGEIKETTFSALRDEVAEDGYVYVIPFANEDAEGYSKTSFDVNKVEANVLVIVD